MNKSNHTDDKLEFERDLSTLFRAHAEQLPVDVITDLNQRRQNALTARVSQRSWQPIAAAAIVTLALTTWMALPTLQRQTELPEAMFSMTEADLETIESLDMLASMDMLAVMADI